MFAVALKSGHRDQFNFAQRASALSRIVLQNPIDAGREA
jgi:hypothetical protein